MVAIVLDNVSHRYAGGTTAAEALCASLAPGRITAILGPSGSGKTTLLRLVAGLEHPSAGTIRFDDRDVTTVAPARRGVAMVFQQFVLFPHWTVRRNIAFSVRHRADREDRVAEVAALLGMDRLLDRYPQQLSGGQQQRVALARALAGEPAVLLLDEPLAHVDAPLRAEILEVLRSWQRRRGTTVLYVTHDVHEAQRIADDILLLVDGRTVQSGTVEQVLRHPVDSRAARWLGVETSAEAVAARSPDTLSTLSQGEGKLNS